MREQPLVLLARGVGGDEGEHLDLLELVHAEDAARVAAGGAGLAAEARGEAGIAQRRLDRLAGMQGRERHLARPGEVEPVLGERVDLLLGVGQEPGPEQRRLAHEHRGQDRLEALLDEQFERPAEQGELQQDDGRP